MMKLSNYIDDLKCLASEVDTLEKRNIELQLQLKEQREDMEDMMHELTVLRNKYVPAHEIMYHVEYWKKGIPGVCNLMVEGGVDGSIPLAINRFMDWYRKNENDGKYVITNLSEVNIKEVYNERR